MHSRIVRLPCRTVFRTGRNPAQFSHAGLHPTDPQRASWRSLVLFSIRVVAHAFIVMRILFLSLDGRNEGSFFFLEPMTGLDKEGPT